MANPAQSVSLETELCGIRLKNPLLSASGTFGFGQEIKDFYDPGILGGVVAKTVTLKPRPGNPGTRVTETPSGMLNSIGLMNVGFERYVTDIHPEFQALNTLKILNVAGHDASEFALLVEQSCALEGLDMIELNLSCPNVSGGADFSREPKLLEQVVSSCKERSTLPLLVKLSPNVTNIAEMAKRAEGAGADGITAINTVEAMDVDWQTRKPVIDRVLAGLSGPAIRPVALACVWKASQAVSIPVVGVGGIHNVDDVMKFLVAGASAVQLGTVNFVNPMAGPEILQALPACLQTLGCSRMDEVIGSLACP